MGHCNGQQLILGLATNNDDRRVKMWKRPGHREMAIQLSGDTKGINVD